MECGEGEEYEGKRHNLARHKVPAMVPGWLQSLVAMAAAAWQLAAKSVMRLQAGGPHPGQAPCHHRESPGSDAWQGTGYFADGAEQDVPVRGFLRFFG